MTVLALVVEPTEVTASVSADGRVTSAARLPLTPHPAGPGRSELVAEDLWRTVLGVLRTVADEVPVSALSVTGPSASLLLWDTETLGSPRPAVLAPDRRAADPAAGLAWVAEHEPHTWALVLDERYAAGPVASYVVARMTRGLQHVTTDPAWSADRAAELGVPAEALPELVPPGTEVGVTDPRLVLGMRLPISLPPAGGAA